MIAAIAGFARSSGGRVVLGAAAGVALVIFVYLRGYHAGEADSRADALKAQLEAVHADLAIAEDAAADAAARAADLAAQNETNREIMDDQQAALAGLSVSDRCVWSDDQRGRLCDILGTCAPE